MVLVFLAEGYLSFFLLVSFVLIMSSRVGKPLKHSLRGIKPILFIAVFMMVVNTIAVKGRPFGTMEYSGTFHGRELLCLSRWS